jgi:hypothetical protein
MDTISVLVPISFILFTRCIQNDIQDYIKGDDTLSPCTEDNYFSSKLQKLFLGKEVFFKDYVKDYKRGHIHDVKHFVELKDPKIIKDIFTERVQYIVINCILVIILLSKYNYKQFIPLFLIWFFITFS